MRGQQLPRIMGFHGVTRAQPLVTIYLPAVSSAVEAVMLLKDRPVIQRRHQNPANFSA
jgi:hypothetical protein